MRVLLLVSDSRPAGKSGGRVNYSPGWTEVDEILGAEWVKASLALDVRDDAVHAPAGEKLCSAHSASRGTSCTLLAGHKGGRHYDFSGLGQKGEALGAGWWIEDQAPEAIVTSLPKACPTIGCHVGPLGHGGLCHVPAPAPAPTSTAAPSDESHAKRKGKA